MTKVFITPVKAKPIMEKLKLKLGRAWRPTETERFEIKLMHDIITEVFEQSSNNGYFYLESIHTLIDKLNKEVEEDE